MTNLWRHHAARDAGRGIAVDDKELVACLCDDVVEGGEGLKVLDGALCGLDAGSGSGRGARGRGLVRVAGTGAALVWRDACHDGVLVEAAAGPRGLSALLADNWVTHSWLLQ